MYEVTDFGFAYAYVLQLIKDFLIVLICFLISVGIVYTIRFIKVKTEAIENERIRKRLRDIIEIIECKIDEYIGNGDGELNEQDIKTLEMKIRSMLTNSSQELLQRLGLNLKEIIKSKCESHGKINF